MTDSSAEVSLPERLWYIECIKQTKARYFRFIDTKQWSKLRQVFTDDCTFDGLWATGDGPDGFIESISKNLAQLRTIHHGCMPEIEVTSPTTARGIWPMEDYLEAISGSMGYRGVSVEGQRGVRGYGYYYEEYRREGDEWRISYLLLTRHRIDPLLGPVEPEHTNMVPPLDEEWLPSLAGLDELEG